MGKVKAAVITSLVVIAIIVAAVFGVASFNVSATQRYNSIAANIPLGSEYSGYIYTTVYPEGVVTELDDDLTEEERAEYTQEGDYFVNLQESGYEDIQSLREAVASDAKILSQRMSERRLSDYYVSVRDGLSITVGVPSGYSYAAYKGDSSGEQSAAYSTLGMLLADGYLTLRTSDATITSGDSSVNMTQYADEYTDELSTYPFRSSSTDFASYFSSVSSYTFAGTHVLSFNLTPEGRSAMRDITSLAASSESQTIYVCIGTTQVLGITCTSTMDSDTMQFQMGSADAAADAATVLNSVVGGGALSVAYHNNDATPLLSTAGGGENAALMAFIACVVVLAALCIAAVVKYRRLGGVLTLSLVILALVLLYGLYFLSVQVTFEVLIACAAVLVIFAGTNLFVLAEVRAQCKTGKTMQAAVKAAYKRTLLPVIDIHVIILVAAILLASVAVGAAAACGLILVVGVIASYVLYWFTRFMWYVLSAPMRNKFAFGGFKREVYGDDE